jgi:hypothetical protein
MKQDTKPELVGGEQLQAAILQAAMPSEEGAIAVQNGNEKKPTEKGTRPTGKGGVPVPGGRPKGVPNKATKTIREAVMEAFHIVGGPAYLVQLAQGTQSDRTAFTSLLNKVLPTQINANVEGGIKLELSWLGARQIGTTAAQPVEEVTQVIDLERDAKGKYRIADQQHTNIAGGVGGTEAAGGDKDMGK